MTFGTYVIQNICSFALNYWALIILGIVCVDIYTRYFKTNVNTEVDLMEAYVKLQLMKRYKV